MMTARIALTSLVGFCVWSSLPCLGQLPSASWSVGDAAVLSKSSAYAKTTKGVNDEPGVASAKIEGQVVFSSKGFKYDDHGKVIDYETIHRPTANVMANSNWEGEPQGTVPGMPMVGFFGLTASGSAWGILRADADAPFTETVPVRVQIKGHVSASRSANNDYTSTASAYSHFHCQFWTNVIDIARSASVFVEFGTPTGASDEYDETLSVEMPVDSLFSVSVEANAGSVSKCGVPERTCFGTAQAFADPEVSIDPLYPESEHFSIEWSENMPQPEEPLRLGVGSLTNGVATILLVCPSNNVCAIEASTNLLSTNWVQLAEVTNNTATTFYADMEGADYVQGFYRARALRKAE